MEKIESLWIPFTWNFHKMVILFVGYGKEWHFMNPICMKFLQTMKSFLLAMEKIETLWISFCMKTSQKWNLSFFGYGKD